MFQAVLIFWLLLDFLSKQLVVHLMYLGESVPLWEGVFYLNSVRNSGAAFSMMQNQFMLFYGAMFLLAAMVAWFWLSERPTHWMPVLGTALVMAGAMGNTIDRLAMGAVVDMFDFRLINFAVFNVADVGITVGGALFIYWLLFLSGELNWRELFRGRELATVSADCAAASPVQLDGASSAAQSTSVYGPVLPKLSLWERFELRLQKWEADIESEESRD
jgi:signal peptidase II